jgi:hypothetical protein
MIRGLLAEFGVDIPKRLERALLKARQIVDGIGDRECCAPAWSSESIMPKNPPPPICTKCRRPMQFLLRKNIGGRKFQCLNCEGDDPLRSAEVAKLLTGELRPLK